MYSILLLFLIPFFNSSIVERGLVACTIASKITYGKYVRSGCTTALNVVPWETDGESVLKEAMTNTIVTTPVKVTGAPVTNIVANHAEKLEKFNGQKFKRLCKLWKHGNILTSYVTTMF
ncbi:hypothetical protein Tco_0942777 [Tanacetum coccineum]